MSEDNAFKKKKLRRNRLKTKITYWCENGILLVGEHHNHNTYAQQKP
jgi:hypothetical protein